MSPWQIVAKQQALNCVWLARRNMENISHGEAFELEDQNIKKRRTLLWMSKNYG